jgi:hypothetical protein
MDGRWTMANPHAQLPGTPQIWNASTLELVRDIDAVLAARPTDREALVALRLAIAEMLGACDALLAEPLPPPPVQVERRRKPRR